jgi:hypothetical protein
VQDIDFGVDFVARNSSKLQKLGLEGKISWALNVFTLPKLEIFNSTNVKNKECVYTWANNTSYTSKHENWTIHLLGQSRAYIILQWLFLRSLYVGILFIYNSFKFCDIEKLTILSKNLAKLVKFYIKKK